MGGEQSLNFGLGHLDTLAWIGAFSSAPNPRPPAEFVPDPAAAGHGIIPQQVCFAHSAPLDASEHRRFFRGPVRFGAGSTSMILSMSDAARPMLGADEALSSVLRRRLEKALVERDLQEAGPFGGRVRRLMVEHRGGTTLTPSAVARALTVSRRTLSRRLADEGTSFRHILDDVRASSPARCCRIAA
jgi:AraC-like DNA-binding protein